MCTSKNELNLGNSPIVNAEDLPLVLTVAEVAKLLGVGKSQISELERGSASTTLEKLSLICQHYNVSADYLLGLTDEPEPYKRKKI